MNYPVWDVVFGAGLLVALVSIVHVFVSHFAVGGGLFLVLTEMKAYRENDEGLLGWLKKHTKFFVLLTVVFGAITGVGIWFTIGLTSPSATSALIHTYVWGWALEWIFFFVEITAALMYLYGWNKLNRKTHLWFGWVYFIAAFISMVIINGIITFMLTSGTWIENREFWSGFFNPTYWPSLFLRFGFSLALAGIYALLTASLQKDAELKGKIVRWSAKWIIPSFVVLPLFALWYIGNIPPELFTSSTGGMPTATQYATLIIIFSVVTFVLSLLTLVKPKKVPFVFSLLVLVSAFATMWSFEFIREAIRKPYIISGYMYGNSIFVSPEKGDGGFTIENINEQGILNTAKWVQTRDLNEQNKVAGGKEIFRVECQSCHTADAYRGIKQYLKQRNWDEETIYQMTGGLDLMHNKVMPPFAGTEQERAALAAYMAEVHPATPAKEALTGQQVYEKYCISCHLMNEENTAIPFLQGEDSETISVLLEDLPILFERMPTLELTERERLALAEWLRQVEIQN